MLFGDPNLNSLRPQVEQLSFSVGDFIPVARSIIRQAQRPSH
jgi:hypothetical protein